MRLTANGLSASRGGERIFSGLAFAVEAGSALIVTGVNGAGKSTLLRVVAGLLRPDAGSVALEDRPEGVEAVAEACHYLGHRNGIKRELTVAENLGFWRNFMAADAFAGNPRMEIAEAADAVGLEATLQLPFGYLSAGQQRRIAMARLLVAHRPVWILDEPTAALDAAAEAMFIGLVERHLAGGGVAIVATHQTLALTSQQELVLDSRPPVMADFS